MKFSRYEIIARIFPAVLTAIPFYVLYYFLVGPQLSVFFESLLSLKVVSDVTVAIALLFLAMQMNRHLSKELCEKRLFRDSLHFPTTYYLLHSNGNLPSEVKARLHEKIRNDFGITVPDVHEEARDEHRSRQVIVECVSQIRLRVGEGTLTYQHNIEYGFVRNLVGGSVLGVVASIIATDIYVWIYPNTLAMWISIVLLMFYALVIVFGDYIVKSYGENYCRVLLREYLAS
jgi:hypothetical protein